MWQEVVTWKIFRQRNSFAERRTIVLACKVYWSARNKGRRCWVEERDIDGEEGCTGVKRRGLDVQK